MSKVTATGIESALVLNWFLTGTDGMAIMSGWCSITASFSRSYGLNLLTSTLCPTELLTWKSIFQKWSGQ